MVSNNASANMAFLCVFFRVIRKPQTKATLPEHVTEEIDKHAKALEVTRGEYLARIAIWWFAQQCPPVSEHEAEVRRRIAPRRAS